MIELHEIPITIKIQYQASEYSESGWPLIRVSYDSKTIANFEANNSTLEFTIKQNINSTTSCLCVEHYGKNYQTDNKFFEVKKIFVNNIDLEHLLWDGVQYPILAPWEEQCLQDVSYPGNLYLGHNGRIEWKFNNPILLDIQKRLGRNVTQIQGQETTQAVLDQIKDYFWNQLD